MRLIVRLVMVLSGIIFLSGCTTPVADVTEEVQPHPDAALILDDQEALKEAFDIYVKTAPGLVNVRAYVEKHITEAGEKVADHMVYELIAHGDFDIYDETDMIFEEANIGIHNHIYDIYEAHGADFVNGQIFVGEDKERLMSYVLDETYADYLDALFKQGYGLVLRKGAYYPVTDYVAMVAGFGANVSRMTYEYLCIMERDLTAPIVVEEYLAIPLETLGERAVEAEGFLMTYKDNPKQYRGDVGKILATCLWKLSGPNIYDGTLKEDFTLRDELKQLYEEILDQSPTPLVTAAVIGITNWIEGDDDGVLGSKEDMSAVYEASNDVFRDVMVMMDELYPMK